MILIVVLRALLILHACSGDKKIVERNSTVPCKVCDRNTNLTACHRSE